jgi:O-antigen/teichoic acid export membrane protein
MCAGGGRMLDTIKEQFVEGKTLLQFVMLNGLGYALGMIAPLVIAKFLSPELFGSYALAKMIAFFFLTIFVSSAQIPFVVSANQERADSGRINKSFSIQCLFMAAGLCFFAVVVAPTSGYLSAFAKIDGREFVFVCLAFVGFAIEGFFANLFMAMGQRIRSSFVELTFGSLTIGLVFVLYWAGAISVKNVFIVHFVSSITVALIFIWAVDFEKLRPFTVDQKYFKDMFNFTKWVILGSIAAYCINWGDSLVLRVFNKPLGDIGTYNLGYSIFKGILTLTVIINTYFLPFVSQHIDNSKKVREYFYIKRPRILLLGVVGIGLLFVVSPYFFKIVYGDVYQESATVLRVLLFGLVLILYSIFYDPVFHATRRYKFTQTLNIVQAIVNLTLDCLLVPRMGLLGAAVGSVSGYFCRAVTMEVYFRVKLKKLLNL